MERATRNHLSRCPHFPAFAGGSSLSSARPRHYTLNTSLSVWCATVHEEPTKSPFQSSRLMVLKNASPHSPAIVTRR